MKWVGISGTWRLTNAEVEKDVRAAIREIYARGDGMVSGGAVGVDYFATDEMLKLDPSASHVKVALPSDLETYIAHYEKAWQGHAISEQQAGELIRQLRTLHERNPASIIAGAHDEMTRETYYDRNSVVVDFSDELRAFHVNGSRGTQDTIEKARAKGIPVTVTTYVLPDPDVSKQESK